MIARLLQKSVARVHHVDMDATKLPHESKQYREAVLELIWAEMGRHARMSGQELARRSGIGYRTLMRRLEGALPFTLDELVAIAQALDVRVTDLMPEIGTEKRRGADLRRIAQQAGPEVGRPRPQRARRDSNSRPTAYSFLRPRRLAAA